VAAGAARFEHPGLDDVTLNYHYDAPVRIVHHDGHSVLSALCRAGLGDYRQAIDLHT
jgi:hypothetical protein